MKGMRSLSAIFALTGILGFSATTLAADGVLKQRRSSAAQDYCNMKFPAIQEGTLNWDRPALKPRTTGDVIDFYGHCNHNPLGREEVKDQRDHWASENIHD